MGIELPPVCREPVGEGMQVSCLGDSNTMPWQGFDSWCEKIATQLRTENCGWGGATASPNSSPYPYFNAWGQIAAADSEIVVLAFGTNDIGLLGKTPTQIAVELALLFDHGEKAGFRVYVATVPPRLDTAEHYWKTILTNWYLRRVIPATRLIDFDRGFEEHLLPDGVHFEESGHELRAERVLEIVE